MPLAYYTSIHGKIHIEYKDGNEETSNKEWRSTCQSLSRPRFWEFQRLIEGYGKQQHNAKQHHPPGAARALEDQCVKQHRGPNRMIGGCVFPAGIQALIGGKGKKQRHAHGQQGQAPVIERHARRCRANGAKAHES